MEEKTYTEAEIYVRDHLILEFMATFYCENHIEIEEVYDHWISWLEEMEGQHAERSKI